MSLLPILFSDYDYPRARPSQIFNQRFGLDLDPADFLAPITRDLISSRRSPAGYYRPWLSTAAKEEVGSTVSTDSDKFQISLDVQQFAPNEISVKAAGENTIVVEGKHEEKPDEHGFISRHFVRKYLLPKGHDIGRVSSSLSSDGVLTIIAPKAESLKGEQRSIPIQQTGVPSKPVEKKEEVKEEAI